MTRRDAIGMVKTARAVEASPAVRDAVESGRVSAPNARRLAEAIEKTSADAVEADSGLLANAESMRPEQFTREARRWASDRQDDGGEGDYQRMRARRCVRVWDADDGMVRVHGEFDPVSGRRIANRLQAAARRMYDADKKQAAGNGSERRSFNQCMADALDSLTSDNSTRSGSGAGKAFADICVVAHVDDATGRLVAELPDGNRLPQAVLERLACNAEFTGVVFDRAGKPIWRAQPVRAATEAQRQLLIAEYGGCFHCKANPAMCQIHHIKPVSQGGATSIKEHGPGVLGLPRQDPLRRLADPHQPRRRPHTAPARAGPTSAGCACRLASVKNRRRTQVAQPSSTRSPALACGLVVLQCRT